MKIYLSGVVRKDRFELLLDANTQNLILDYSVAKKYSSDELEDTLTSLESVMLEYDLSSQWSKIKYLWQPNDSRHAKDVEKHGSLQNVQTYHIERITKRVNEYFTFASTIQHLVDIVWTPHLPIEHEFLPTSDIEPQKIGRLKKVFKNFSDYIYGCSHIAISNEVDLQDLKVKIQPHIASIKSFGVKLHRLGRVDKETALTGLFWSASSSNWISGGKHGTTFEYVGNLKLNTYHASKGAGKNVRVKLKAKCEALNLDHSLLMKDDPKTVNLWNVHQWVLLAKEMSSVTGYLYTKEGVSSDKQLSVIQKSSNSPLATTDQIGTYLRNCNSCYLSANCPLFEADSTCRITSTPTVQTPDDIKSLLNNLIQIQGERVLFASMSEKIQNAGINPEVSKEMETLTRIMKDAKEITSVGGGDEVTIRAKGSGVISRLFGGYGRSGGGSKPSTSETIIDVSPMESEDD